ncbi:MULTISPECIES: alpha-L-rhamnosidase C-terminal domain-containing protein [unclassified Streptomyces]|uniref:alpha-L-rhamnosidase C-terminal domain-containing protein n=1 Tax=unclassified Streptomyces TaxID=2593676 RepID=UPI003369CD13
MRPGPRHRTAAGLAPATLGYRRLRIVPPPGGGVTQAGARLCTPYGTAEVSWALSGRELTVEAVVPPNTTADVVLPDGRASSRWAPEPRRDHRTGARRSDARRREVPDRPGRAGFGRFLRRPSPRSRRGRVRGRAAAGRRCGSGRSTGSVVLSGRLGSWVSRGGVG